MYIIFLWEAGRRIGGKQRPPAPPSGRRAVDQAVSSSSVLGLHQADAAILLPQLGLFNLAGGVTGDGGEDDLPGALVPGQVSAELVDLALCAGHALFDLDDGGGDLPQPLVGQAR